MQVAPFFLWKSPLVAGSASLPIMEIPMTHIPSAFVLRRFCILLAGLAVTSALAAAPFDGADRGSPPIEPSSAAPRMLRFAPETIEYGEVEPGKPVTAKLTITNISGAPITVEGIKGGCGCTTVTAPPKDPVAAGASFTVDVTMDPGTKPGVALVKPVHVTMGVISLESPCVP